MAGGGAGGTVAHLLKFSAVGKSSLPEKNASRYAKFGAETPISGIFQGKIEIFSTHNLLSEICSCLSEKCNFLLSALEVIFNVMRSINPRFTYLLTFKPTPPPYALRNAV